MEILILIAAHLFGDFALQDSFQAATKGDNLYILFVHSALWTTSIIIGLYILGYILSFPHILWLFVTHMCIDKWKCSKKDKTNALTYDLYIDQVLHMCTICITLYWLKGF